MIVIQAAIYIRKFFKETGIKKIYTNIKSKEHNKNLQKMTYIESESDDKI